MERGLKVEGGDQLGKTIVFSRTHEHAEFIVSRFDLELSPPQGPVRPGNRQPQLPCSKPVGRLLRGRKKRRQLPYR